MNNMREVRMIASIHTFPRGLGQQPLIGFVMLDLHTWEMKMLWRQHVEI